MATRIRRYERKVSGKTKTQPVRYFHAYVKAVGNYDGSAIGCAYIISEHGETYDEGRSNLIGVRSYEAEFRAIVAAAKVIPDGCSIVVSTNNQLLESLNYLKKPQCGDKFYSLKKSLWEQKQRLRDVKIVFNKKVFNNMWLNSAADMAEEEFLTLCQTKGIRNQLSYSA